MGNEKKPWEIGKSFDRSAPIGPITHVFWLPSSCPGFHPRSAW